MRRLVYTVAATRDLRAIAAYISRESGSVTAARVFTEQLRQQCVKLAALPGTLGRARPDLRIEVRSVPFRSYVILFRYKRDRVEIVAVVEGHRDLQALFSVDDKI